MKCRENKEEQKGGLVVAPGGGGVAQRQDVLHGYIVYFQVPDACV